MAIKGDAGQNPQFYADLGSLQQLKRQAKTDTPEALKQVAQQFEQMFLSMLTKSMRDANESFGEDNVFNSSEVRFYQDMLDSQLTTEMSQSQGVGLADVLVRQLSRQFDVRMDQDKQERDRSESLSEAEQLLNRAFDQGAVSAASVVLSRAMRPVEQAPSVTPIEEALDQLVDRAQNAPARDNESLPEKFESPEAFVTALLPQAEKVAQELGVDPKVLLAQAALETGWGKHIIRDANGDSSYNLFNIKADKRWGGERAQVNTLEYRDGAAQKERAFFRSYQSYEQSFRDYADFLKNSPRYQQALEMASDPRAYLKELQAAGYATDPAYAEKITDIFERRIAAMNLNAVKEG